MRPAFYAPLLPRVSSKPYLASLRNEDIYAFTIGTRWALLVISRRLLHFSSNSRPAFALLYSWTIVSLSWCFSASPMSETPWIFTRHRSSLFLERYLVPLILYWAIVFFLFLSFFIHFVVLALRVIDCTFGKVVLFLRLVWDFLVLSTVDFLVSLYHLSCSVFCLRIPFYRTLMICCEEIWGGYFIRGIMLRGICTIYRKTGIVVLVVLLLIDHFCCEALCEAYYYKLQR